MPDISIHTSITFVVYTMVFQCHDITQFKQQALTWAAGFGVCCCLDSNDFKDDYHQFDFLVAAGEKTHVTSTAGNAFDDLQVFKTANPGWALGFIAYDLKNETEQLTSAHTDQLHFPDLYFFAPEHLLIIRGNEIEVSSPEAAEILEQINRQEVKAVNNIPPPSVKSRFNREDYVAKVHQIQQHISWGDIYVTNFCQEFYAENSRIDPVGIWQELNRISPNPFACFFKYQQQYIIGASPERYLAKRENLLISQPIKGTAPRSAGNDEAVKQQLRQQPKEQQENVMIVDLVRNDLTRCAAPGSVEVKELFGIYSFAQVHQMISTITAQLNEGSNEIAALKLTFPMGSMTGAPKVSAMQLMEQYEMSKRGIYSGAVGYFAPGGNFDFSVVIRTLLYNAGNHYLSFHTGSAITFDADAEQEYEECLLKAKAIMQALGALHRP